MIPTQTQYYLPTLLFLLVFHVILESFPSSVLLQELRITQSIQTICPQETACCKIVDDPQT